MGIKRDCEHQRVRHRHGTGRAYNSDGCRCDECREAKRRERAMYRTRPASLVSAQPAREHITRLRESGMSLREIAEIAGVDHRTVWELTHRSRPKLQQITEASLLAVPWMPNGSGHVSAVGTLRRLQALQWCGWSSRKIAAKAGLSKQAVQSILWGRYPHVTFSTAQAVQRAFVAIWDQIPEPSGQVTYIKRLARERGYAPPIAWDDDTIDDPEASPYKPPTWRDDFDPEADKDRELQELVNFGFSIPELARMWKITPQSIERRLDRRGIERAA